MSRANRDAKLRLKLEAAESDFRELLISSLCKCRDGGRGVFLTEDTAARLGDLYPKLVWPEARQLAELGKKIESLRGQLGEPPGETLYAKYQEYCARSGPNDPGCGKPAAQLLAEIESKGSSHDSAPAVGVDRGWKREDLYDRGSRWRKTDP